VLVEVLFRENRKLAENDEQLEHLSHKNPYVQFQGLFTCIYHLILTAFMSEAFWLPNDQYYQRDNDIG
jgi:hypothetical protein